MWSSKGGKPNGVHVMLVAPDDDCAVRRALEALTREGYAEAELDQIGDMEGEPDEEPHLSAYQGRAGRRSVDRDLRSAGVNHSE